MIQGQWVAHTHEVLRQLEVLSGELVEAKAIQQPPVSNNDKNARIKQTLDRIQSLTQDNPGQQLRIKTLRQSIASGPATATIGQNIDNMRQEESRLLTKRLEQWHTAAGRTRLFFLGGLFTLYTLIIAVYLALRREAATKEKVLVATTLAASMQRALASRMSQIVDIQQTIITQRLDLEKAMQVITDQAQAVTHADGAVVEMYEYGYMVYRAASGTLSPFIGLKLKAEGSLSGLCVSSGTMLTCEDSEVDSRVDAEACRKVGLRSMIVVPLIQQDEMVGVLKVAAARINGFTAEDASTLRLIAGVLSSTLRDAVATDALQQAHERLSQANALLEARANTDGMTGLKNHLHFQERLVEEYGRSKRYNNALSLLLLDIDHFKKFNDQFGHQAGDAVLKQVASLLKTSARPSDCAARYGGEEFAIILPQTPLEGAYKMAERFRQSIQNAAWEGQHITISIGISGLENNPADAAALIKQADMALYQSKANGRNRITRFG